MKRDIKKKRKKATVYCDNCPLRGIDGGPGPVMVCEHPNAPDMGYIIQWDDKREHRVPSKKCPNT